MGKRTAQKDTIIDITSDSQANSNFPYRWSPASLTFNNYFYLFLYLYITRMTINNNTPRLKSPKNQNRRTALSRTLWRKKSLLYDKSNVVTQKVCKKKCLSWVYDVDRKIRHAGSLFGITRQASWCRSVTVTDFSIHTIQPWKILTICNSWF